MVTSEQILEATGLRAAKTLTRWQRAGIIPAPQVGTHPSGRGKIAYYPDWVLDRCRRIVELQRQGHGLRSAVLALQTERVVAISERAEAGLALQNLLREKKLAVGDGLQVDLMTLVHAKILQELRPILDRDDLRHALRRAMGSENIAGWALHYVLEGYNPVLVSDGTEVEVVPDFMVAHRLGGQALAPQALIVIPLFGIVRDFFRNLDTEMPDQPKISSSPAISLRKNDAEKEYRIHLTGTGVGFEIIKEPDEII